MKTFLTIYTTTLITALITYSFTLQQIDFTIYTTKNIYYIKGYEVRNEKDSTIKKFTSLTKLKNYIEFTTANEL